MIDESEQLDAALDSESSAISPDVRELVELAREIGAVLTAGGLSPARRAEIHGRVLELVDSYRWRAPWRRLRRDPRAALLGGAAIATVAAAAVGVALVRGRHQDVPVAA